MQSVIKSVWGRIVAYFLAGVLAVLPLVITVGLVVWIMGFIDNLLGPNSLLGDWLGAVTVLGWIITLGVVFGLGIAIVEFGAKSLFKRVVDPLISRIPLIGSIYGTSEQFIDMFGRHDQGQLQGMTPVFCHFGKEHGAGVLALLVTPEEFAISGRKYQIVIIPTAPLPFGGGMLFMPVESVQPADMSVDALLSVYVSMGAATSKYLPPERPEVTDTPSGDSS